MNIKELISRIGIRYKDGSSLTPGTLYHPLPFPEYADVPVHKTNCIDELTAMQACYDFKGKTVFEIGSNAGYFTFNLSKVCGHVVGFEADESVRQLAEAVANDKEILNVTFLSAFTPGFAEIVPDVYVMLNVHMWLVKQLGFEAVKEIMRNIAKSGADLIFQTAHAESRGMYTVKELKDLDGIIEYLKDCGFKDPRYVYTSMHDGHPRYMVIS